jgi:hypothetical protein
MILVMGRRQILVLLCAGALHLVDAGAFSLTAVTLMRKKLGVVMISLQLLLILMVIRALIACRFWLGTAWILK